MIHTLFDIDGTLLLVPRQVDKDSSSIMFKKVFQIDANEEMVDNSARPEKHIVTEVLKKFNILPKDKLISAYKAWGEAEVKLLRKQPGLIMPGMVSLLKKLHENKNISIKLLTGNSSFRAEAKLKSTGLDKYFRDPLSRKLVGVFGEEGNTREELLLKFLKNKKDEDKVIIFDDSLLGGAMAKKNEIPIILVATGKTPYEVLKQYSHNIFHDLGENRWEKALEIIEFLS
jgi:phosphoglycolate phosphatase-like HAD superfamily hydrolase